MSPVWQTASSANKVTFLSSLRSFAAYVLLGGYVLILSRYCKTLLSLHCGFPDWDFFYCSYSSVRKTLFSNMSIMQSRSSVFNRCTTAEFILWRRQAMTQMSCVLWVYQIFAYSYFFTYMGWLCSVCLGGLMNPKQVERVHHQETPIFLDIWVLWEAVHATHVVEYYEIRCYWKCNQVLFWKRTTQSRI